jgi:hypothetical protein
MANEFQDPNDAAERLAEEGFPLPEAQRSDSSRPPGDGKLILPHVTSFASVINLVSRSYRWQFDEALRASQTNALAIRRDPVIMDALRSRQIPTVQLPWHLEAEDDTDKRQTEAASVLTNLIEEIPRFQTYKLHLTEAVWYGRYAVQNVYRWQYRGGQRRLVVADYRPINGDKLVFRFSGQVGVVVHPAFYEGPTSYTDRGRVHFLTPEEREQLVLHHHEPEDADFTEPELGGGIFGVGVRSRIYWLWWLRSQVMAFLMDYLERVGAGGFTIYYFESGNPTSLQEVKTAAEEQWRNNAIIFPRYRSEPNAGPGVQRVEPSPAGAQLLESLIVEYFDNVIRRFILGQSLTSEAAGTGLGSGVADLHADTFGRIVKFDAISLQETLTKDLVRVLAKYNFPELPPPKFVFDVDKPNAAEVLEAAKSFYEMGGQVDEDELRGVLGLSKPQAGHSVLAQVPAISPTGVGAVPQGVPMEGQPGPVPAGGGNGPPGGGAPDQPDAGEKPYLFAREPRGRVKLAALEAHPGVLKNRDAYLKTRGLSDPGHLDYVSLNPQLSKRIADYYDRAKHDPTNPQVKSSYDAFKRETLAQYRHLQSLGVRLEPWLKEGQPYANSNEMVADVRGNNHLYHFVGGDMPADHPLAEPIGDEVNGHPLTYNDAFRAVHDYYGHALYGNQFGPRGEEHAYRTHSRMYSPEAVPAMAFETRGQNSWVNFGPHSHLPVPERPYAEQKANVLPEELRAPAQPERVQLAAASSLSPQGANVPTTATPQEEDVGPPSQAYTPRPVNPRMTMSVFPPSRGKFVMAPETRAALEPIYKGEHLTPPAEFYAEQFPEGVYYHGPDPHFPIGSLERYLAGHERDLLGREDSPMREKIRAELDPNRTPHRASPKALAEYAWAGRGLRHWYEHSSEALDRLFPEPRDRARFTALLGAFSPQNDVLKNLKWALDTWRAWEAEGRPTNPARVKKILADLKAGTVPGVSAGPGEVLGANGEPVPIPSANGLDNVPYVPNVTRVLAAGPDETSFVRHLQGLKITSFVHNLHGDSRFATFDTHHSRAEGVPQSTYAKMPGYLASLVRVRQAQELLNETPGRNEEHWTPEQIQAAIWGVSKGVSDRIHGGDIKPGAALAAFRRLTHRDIVRLGDFGSLLRDPRIATRLDAMGLRGRADEALEHLDKRVRHGGRVLHTQEFLESPIHKESEHDFGPGFARHEEMLQKSREENRKKTAEREKRPLRFAAGDGASESAAVSPPEPHLGTGDTTFYSPNVDEGLSFEQAFARLTGSNQKAFKQMSEDIFKGAGVGGYEIHDAIGDWSDGAENSLVHVLNDPPNPATSRYLAAWHGLLANQKAVLTFQANEDGPDSVYQVYVPEPSANAARKALDRVGIQYRTIVPMRGGQLVVVFDEGRKLRPNVEALADQYDASVREARGSGEFLGGPTRTAARAAYRRVIRGYEAHAGPQEPVHPGEAADGPVPAGRQPSEPKSAYQFSRPAREVIRFAGGLDKTLPPDDQLHDVSALHREAEKSAPQVLGGSAQPPRGLGPRSLLGVSKKVFQALEKRYGKKQAVAIIASGHVLSWAASGLGALNHTPVYVPSLAASAPAWALAELYHQVKRHGSDLVTMPLGKVKALGKKVVDAIAAGHQKLGDVNAPQRFQARRVARLAARQSPEGGMAWRGLYYPGGEFVPDPPGGEGVDAEPPAAVTSPPKQPAASTLTGTQAEDVPLLKPTKAAPAEPQAPEEPQQALYGHQDAAHQQLVDAALTNFGRHLKASDKLTLDHHAHYTAAARKVLAAMPHKAMERFNEGALAYDFHPDVHELTEVVQDRYPNLDRRGGANGFGLYGGTYDPAEGLLTLDGGLDTNEPQRGGKMRAINGIYAHEFTHALDHELSFEPEWQRAWMAEINRPDAPLSKYARKDEREGFAEFGRLLYGGGFDLAKVEAKFPKASAYFKANGLWPGGEL